MSSLEIHIQVRHIQISPTALHALTAIDSFDWILFTSKHAVEFFITELHKHHILVPQSLRIGVVGNTTASAVRAHGLTVTKIPKVATVQALITSLGKIRGTRILFPRSMIAPSVAPKKLRTRGAIVRTIPLYTTSIIPLTTQERSKLLAGAYTKLIFRSPSGVRGLKKQFRLAEWNSIREIASECIGPTTAQEARRQGFTRVSIKPKINT